MNECTRAKTAVSLTDNEWSYERGSNWLCHTLLSASLRRVVNFCLVLVHPICSLLIHLVI